MFSGFTADDPQILLRVNRDRAKQLNVPTDVFQTLQIYTGSAPVNDFTFSNRSYRVYVQADQVPRQPDLTRSTCGRVAGSAAAISAPPGCPCRRGTA